MIELAIGILILAGALLALLVGVYLLWCMVQIMRGKW